VNDCLRSLAYAAGRDAAENGLGRDSCNRIRGTIYFDDWIDGFEEAENMLPLVGKERKND
jgi:hypothetical protein